jgi:hypothetical protein
MTSAKRLVYVLVNSPVGGRLYVEAIYKANPFIEQMAMTTGNNFLSKRNLERLGAVPFPSGPRFQLLPFALREDFFTSESGPSGPDIIDVAHAENMQQVRAAAAAAAVAEAKKDME